MPVRSRIALAERALPAGRAIRRSMIGALLASILVLGHADAEPLTVSAGQPPTALESFVAFLEDPEADLRFEDVSSPPMAQRFRSIQPGRGLNFGPTRSAYWLRFTLVNPTAEAIDLLLEVGYPQLDRIELYQPLPAGGYRSDFLGDTFPLHDRILDLRHFVFPLSLPAKTATTYHLRVQTAGTLNVPLLISAFGPYLERSHGSQLKLGLFYGILLGAVLYNLFLLIAVRDAVYFYLVGHITSMGLALACTDGLAFRLWPTATSWQQWSIQVFIGLVNITTLLFVRRFVSTAEKSPRLDRVLKGLLWALAGSCAVAALWGVRVFYFVNIFWFMTMAVAVTFTVFMHVRRGHRPAMIYAVAWEIGRASCRERV